MEVIQTNIPDVLVFKPDVHPDERGYFMETCSELKLKGLIGETCFVQDNQVYSTFGVLRGLHYQRPPFAQGKLVRVAAGMALNVAVDIRLGSPTFGQHTSVILTGSNHYQLWVPKGFAHGFVVLGKSALLLYKCDQLYAPACDAGLICNDPALGINWMVSQRHLLISLKDKCHPFLKDIHDFQYEDFSKNNISRK